MKHLFFVALTGGIFFGMPVAGKAQPKGNIERPVNDQKPAATPKFIEDIEILPVGAPEVITPTINEPAIERVSIKSTTAPIAKTHFGNDIEACSALQFKYATMLNVEVESITNASLYGFIDDWWATRYHYGGAGRDGIDCSAFTEKLLSQVYGITVPRTANDQFKLCEKLETNELSEGDLVFFGTRRGVNHVGLYLGNNYFVHSSVSSGVAISNLTDDYYSKKFISGGRITLKSTLKEESPAVLVSNPAR